jgi:predicted nucleotidyltransferase
MSPGAELRAELVLQTAQELARLLRERLGSAVVDVRLFGSHARGEADEHSDVDVAVVLEAVDWPTRRQVLDLATDLGLAREVRLSPTLFDRQTFERWQRQERALVVDVLREGLPL